jgi:hypothetical protein
MFVICIINEFTHLCQDNFVRTNYIFINKNSRYTIKPQLAAMELRAVFYLRLKGVIR